MVWVVVSGTRECNIKFGLLYYVNKTVKKSKVKEGRLTFILFTILDVTIQNMLGMMYTYDTFAKEYIFSSLCRH